MSAVKSALFLGVGGSASTDLGHASMALQFGSGEALLVDCGAGVVQRYKEHFSCLPQALFITHCHMDHVGDLESLFYQVWLSEVDYRPQLFVPINLVEHLHRRMASYPGALAEGGVNFWEAFQLIPVSEKFVFAGITFKVYPVRHHTPNTAFALHLPGVFFYSGDTRPIPEVISHEVSAGEIIFHDAGLQSNPSHTGLEDLMREYSPEQRERMWVYHYQSPADRMIFEKQGIRCVLPKMQFCMQNKAPVNEQSHQAHGQLHSV